MLMVVRIVGVMGKVIVGVIVGVIVIMIGIQGIHTAAAGFAHRKEI
jgi:hypothetical protein